MTPFRTVLLFFLVAASGIICIPYLKVDLLPAEKNHQLSVSFSLPNSNPELVEQRVTGILENALSGLNGLKRISSVSRYNGGNIKLVFGKNSDMDFLQFETVSILRRIYPQLPANTSYPVIIRSSDNDKLNGPLITYSINAHEQPLQIKEQCKKIFNRPLAGLPGINDVGFNGAENTRLVIEFDLEKCLIYQITPSWIIQSLSQQYNDDYPGEYSTTGGQQYFIYLPGQSTTLSALEKSIITTPKNTLLRLKDLAILYMEEQEVQRHYRVNGKNSITLNIYARGNENKINIGTQIKNIVNHEKHLLPPGYEMRVEQDETTFIKKEIARNYQRAELALIILLIFLLLSYRNWKYLILLFLGLLTTVLLTFFASWLLRLNIHLYSIAGLAISFGFMIDNSIVMLDYYHRFRNRKIFLALLAANLIVVTSLIIPFLLPEEEKKNLIDFSIVICISLICSLVVSLYFTPGLYDLMFSSKKKSAVTRISANNNITLNRGQQFYFYLIRFIVRFRKSFILLLILSFGIPVFLLPDKWPDHNWYNKTIGHEYYQENIRPHTDKWLGGSFYLFSRKVDEHSGYRDPAKTKLFINARLPIGHTISQMNDLLDNLEKYLLTVQGIDRFITDISSGQLGYIEITFLENYERTTMPYDLKSDLISRIATWSGADWTIFGIGRGFSNTGMDEIPNFRIILKGYNYNELDKQVSRLEQKLLSHKRIQKINTHESLDNNEQASTEWTLLFDDKKMAYFNINRNAVFARLSDLGKSKETNISLNINSQLYPVIIREKNYRDFDKFRLLNKSLPFDSSNRYLRDFSILSLSGTAASIQKEDRQYIRTIGFDYTGSAQFGNHFLDSVLKEMKNEMPTGYMAEKIFYSNNWSKTIRHYSLIALLLFLIYFICSVLFENLKQPFFIILLAPFSLIGLFLIFSLGNFYFDQGGYAAIIMLCGLTINAGIFIINDFNNLNRINSHYNQNIIRAVSNRSRTLLLTTTSSICGVLPFIFEGQQEIFWFSLAIGIMGGLLFSLLSLFIILPVLLWKK